ncbi:MULTISPECIES: RlpA-like double-psi beta-barrel domain-containing protein [Catenuloplanes]|uniref:Secreted protein n=1 Tax=Catenuloplanes niger TaxID=587534 RepID=A0AAE4CRL0_9ACTN|nr:hypothetical protein [Catenuloplanes niger]MDR7323036.1 hypothetical protein [Catenuloplanes niger]
MNWRQLLIGRNRKIVIGVTAVALAGGAFAVGTGISGAAEGPCAGIEAARQRNLDFIAEQRANPDALSDARIKNRQDVIAVIDQQLAAAGCAPAQGGGGADVIAEPPVADAPPAEEDDAPPAEEDAEDAPPAGDTGGDQGGEAGDVVCDGSTVTLSGEAGAPGASSNEFPVGTRLRVTNLDNDKSITVEVTGVSGSCILLNDAAFEQVREPGKFLIRRAVIELVG